MNDYLNLSALCRSLAQTISSECSPISADQLLELYSKRASEITGADLFVSSTGEKAITAAGLFAVYADWITDVGVALGFECQSDESAGEWITVGMPATRAITKQMRKAAVDGLGRLDDEVRGRLGFSPSDVFMRSINTAEPMEQSHARLLSKVNGLKPVK